MGGLIAESDGYGAGEGHRVVILTNFSIDFVGSCYSTRQRFPPCTSCSRRRVALVAGNFQRRV